MPATRKSAEALLVGFEGPEEMAVSGGTVSVVQAPEGRQSGVLDEHEGVVPEPKLPWQAEHVWVAARHTGVVPEQSASVRQLTHWLRLESQ